MINPGIAVDAIVNALQNIPDLVAAVGGAANILSYHPGLPDGLFFRQALMNMSPGQILVRYLGTVPGSVHRENRIWKHEFGVYQVPPLTAATESNAAHYTFLTALINGVPTNGDGNKMLNYAVVPNCDIMDVPKVSIYTDLTAKMDLYVAHFTFPEIGDN